MRLTAPPRGRGSGPPTSPSAAGLLTDHRGARRTAYSCRHFYISQQLIVGADMFVLAKNTGTSSDMIECFYGRIKLERTARELRPEWRVGAGGSHP